MKKSYYQNIIIGAGAAGLYCGCALGGDTLILEKTSRPGSKLLASGSGQCNITHGGSIKDFIGHYGSHGKNIRRVLQRHGNIPLRDFFESLGVSLLEREDGKIFPSSMKSMSILQALLRELERKKVDISCNSPVVKLIPPKISGSFAGEDAYGEAEADKNESSEAEANENAGAESRDLLFQVQIPGKTLKCRNLIIATGGCSYPKTGSDGKMFDILRRDLGLEIVKPEPALTPVYVEDYIYGDLSGISFKNISMNISGAVHRGDLLFTGKNLSGPLVLNNSRYLSPGAGFSLNFLAPLSGQEASARFKRDFPGGGKSPQSYMCEELELPRRFAQKTALELGISRNKVSQLTGGQIRKLAETLTDAHFTVSALAGFGEAMATKGGISLSEIELSKMSSKRYEGLYFIGEAVDVDGDTGGYNLQFAFSSAFAAAESILKKKL